MSDKNIPFHVIDWNTIPKIDYPGDSGNAFWQTLNFPGLRVRIVEYSAGYTATIGAKKAT